MSKELDALERIANAYISKYRYVAQDDDFEIIETALKEQEEDKKLLNEQAKSNRYLMEQIKQSQKKLKALEIIKEKRVDACYFMNCKTLEEYNDDVLASYAYEENDAEQRMLTQEEYELLKEVLI